MHALHNVHAALVPGGILLDTHPVRPASQVRAGGRDLGRLDESAFFAMAAGAEEALEEVVGDGLFEPEAEAVIDIRERLDSVEEFFEIVGNREKTRIPRKVARNVRAAEPPIWLHERLALRVFRRAAGARRLTRES